MRTNDFYRNTDKEIKHINKQILRVFRKKLGIDELNVLKMSKDMYEELQDVATEAYLRIAKRKWPKRTKKWLYALLAAYDPVTGYVFNREIDRKRSRFAEGVIAGTEDGKAQRLLAAMLAWYAIEVTDAAALEQYKEDGVKRVRWVSKDDHRRCKVCEERHMKIYDIGRVPPKPHINCRCVLEPVE